MGLENQLHRGSGRSRSRKMSLSGSKGEERHFRQLKQLVQRQRHVPGEASGFVWLEGQLCDGVTGS